MCTLHTLEEICMYTTQRHYLNFRSGYYPSTSVETEPGNCLI